MSFYHISFDAFLGLAYAAVCAFLALVLVSPVPFKTQIRQYMALAVYYLMYAIAIPMWLFFTSKSRRYLDLTSSDTFFCCIVCAPQARSHCNYHCAHHNSLQL